MDQWWPRTTARLNLTFWFCPRYFSLFCYRLSPNSCILQWAREFCLSHVSAISSLGTWSEACPMSNLTYIQKHKLKTDCTRKCTNNEVSALYVKQTRCVVVCISQDKHVTQAQQYRAHIRCVATINLRITFTNISAISILHETDVYLVFSYIALHGRLALRWHVSFEFVVNLHVQVSCAVGTEPQNGRH